MTPTRYSVSVLPNSIYHMVEATVTPTIPRERVDATMAYLETLDGVDVARVDVFFRPQVVIANRLFDRSAMARFVKRHLEQFLNGTPPEPGQDIQLAAFCVERFMREPHGTVHLATNHRFTEDEQESLKKQLGLDERMGEVTFTDGGYNLSVVPASDIRCYPLQYPFFIVEHEAISALMKFMFTNKS